MARRKRKGVGATQEIVRTEPERAPLPDPKGLAHTSSPVDLPPPAEPLPHPLRWTTTVIAVATALLALLNATAIRGWAYQLRDTPISERAVTLAEAWYDAADGAGLNRPVEAMHNAWQSLRLARFDRESPPPPDMAAAEGPPPQR